jgi:hypothetical protein
MNTSSKRIAGVVLGSLVMLSAAVAPAAAEEARVIAPTDPTLARALGLETGNQFWMGRGFRNRVEIGNFSEPQRVRVCVTQSEAQAYLNVAARVIADGRQIVVPAAHCGEIVGSQITVEPATPLGGQERVTGVYRIVG